MECMLACFELISAPLCAFGPKPAPQTKPVRDHLARVFLRRRRRSLERIRLGMIGVQPPIEKNQPPPRLLDRSARLRRPRMNEWYPSSVDVSSPTRRQNLPLFP